MNSPYTSMNVFTEGFTDAGINRGALNLDRRDFLKTLGAGLLVAFAPCGSLAQESGRGGG